MLCGDYSADYDTFYMIVNNKLIVYNRLFTLNANL